MLEETVADQCIFCRMAAGEIPVEKLIETENLFAIKDINPLAPVHVLIIPKQHIPTLLDLPEEKKSLVGDVFLASRQIAEKLGVDQQGFRIVHNVNEWGGQKIFHMHFHLLGGMKFD